MHQVKINSSSNSFHKLNQFLSTTKVPHPLTTQKRFAFLYPSEKLPVLVLNNCRNAYPLFNGIWNLAILGIIPESNIFDPGLSILLSYALGSLLQSKERSSLEPYFHPGFGKHQVLPMLKFHLLGNSNKISNHVPT